jgi:hypothetical protein
MKNEVIVSVRLESMRSSDKNCGICLNPLGSDDVVYGHWDTAVRVAHAFHRYCLILFFQEGQNCCNICGKVVSNFDEIVPPALSVGIPISSPALVRKDGHRID